MLIAGAGGQGKEVLGVLMLDGFQGELCFFDENEDVPDLLFNKFKVYKTIAEVQDYFQTNDDRFVVGIGHPRLREKMTNKLITAGGNLTSIISSSASIFPYNEPYHGLIMQPGSGISHGVQISSSCLIHINATIGHEVIIGKYVTIGPNTSIIGPSVIEDYCSIGANVTILPKVKLGKNAIVGAGALVNQDLQENETFIGNRP